MAANRRLPRSAASSQWKRCFTIHRRIVARPCRPKVAFRGRAEQTRGSEANVDRESVPTRTSAISPRACARTHDQVQTAVAKVTLGIRGLLETGQYICSERRHKMRFRFVLHRRTTFSLDMRPCRQMLIVASQQAEAAWTRHYDTAYLCTSSAKDLSGPPGVDFTFHTTSCTEHREHLIP